MSTKITIRNVIVSAQSELLAVK